MPDEFDVVVIGGGPSGEHFAGKASAAGLTVAVVEAELAGGECSYWACMPSKTLLRPGQVLATARAVPGAREAVTGPLDVAAALARRDWMTAGWDDAGQAEWLATAGVELVRGRGRLAGERAVDVEGPTGESHRLRARRAVVLAVGSDPVIPPIEGLAEARYWTNREVTSATTAPERLVVLGGGPVGVEMAQAWHRLGSREVTVIEAGDRLLGRMEPFVGEALATAFQSEGIAVHTGAQVRRVTRDGSHGSITVEITGGEEVVGDEIVVATGRRPRTTDLGLDAVGLEPGRPVAVDDELRATGVDGGWLYAIGDANGRALLTHMGKYQARVLLSGLLGRPMRAEAEREALPSVVFTDPQVASVGLTERDAGDRGLAVQVVRVDLSSVAGASIWGEGISGACQLVIDARTGVVLGATLMGPEVGEMLHAATIAIVGRVTMDRLRHAVAAFPTLSEIWLELVEQYFDS